MKILTRSLVARATLTLLVSALGLQCHAATVYLAGFAYSGDEATIDGRFHYTHEAEASIVGDSVNSVLHRMLAQAPPRNFIVESTALADLRDHDQAIVAALVMTDETASVEQIGNGYKLFINLRAQALFFDFKSMTVLRAYPISVALLDVLDHSPTDGEKAARVKQLMLGDTNPGLLTLYIQRLSSATLPSTVTRTLQVSKVSIAETARPLFPQELASTPGAEETWVADTFSEQLSAQTGVPILPFAKGYAIGNVMAMRFADGSIFNLKIPEPDYRITIDVTGLKRVPFGQSAAGSSFIYASYAHIKIEEPLAAHVYLDAALKNGETKAVPIAQQSIDDAPAYEDSMRALFSRTATVLAGTNLPWLRAATTTPDIDKQISDSRTVIQQCK